MERRDGAKGWSEGLKLSNSKTNKPRSGGKATIATQLDNINPLLLPHNASTAN